MRYEKELERDAYAFLDEDPEKAKKTRDIANLIIVLIGMIAGVLLSQFDRGLMAIAMGVMLLLIGIVGIVYNRKIKAYPEQWLRPIAASSAGLALIFLPLYARSGVNSQEHFVTLLLSFAVFTLLLGALLIVSPIFEAAMKKRRCTDTVMATCIETKVVYSGRGGRWYEHIWEYPLGSIKVTASDNIIVSTEKPYVGSIEQIAVNPDDPNDIYRKATSRTVYMILTGSIIMFIGIVLMVMLHLALAQ